MAAKNQTKVKIQPKSERAKEYHEKVFRKRMQQILEEIEQVQLSILIWGPGPSDEALYNKRVQILNELRKKGLDAFFSEEESAEIDSNNLLSEKAKEFVQADAADLIIILRCSYGSVAELHDFADYRALAGKMYIFVDEKTMESYSSLGAVKELDELYRKIEVFKFPDDIASCNLLRRVTDFVLKIQHTKYRAEKNARDWGLI